MDDRIRQAAIWCDRQGSHEALQDIDGLPFLEILIREIAAKGVERVLLLVRRNAPEVVLTAELADLCDIRIEAFDPGFFDDAFALLDRAKPYLDEAFYFLRDRSWFDIPLIALDRQLTRSPDATVIAAMRATPHSAFGGVWAIRRDAIRPDLSPVFVARNAGAGVQGSVERSFDAFYVDLDKEDIAIAERRIRDHRRRPAVFLDRDGVVNVNHGYVGHARDFDWVEGAPEAIRQINRSGRRCFIVTNQSGIGRGRYTEDDYRALRRHIRDLLAPYEAWIDDERYCPFHPQADLPAYRQISDWRKPAPGMMLDLMTHWPIDTERSFMIGDKETDIEAAHAAGLKGYLFTGGRLDTFVDRILRDDVE